MLQKMKCEGLSVSDAPVVVPLVYVLDGDGAIRQAVRDLLRSVGYRVEAFDCAAALLTKGLQQDNEDGPSCIVIEARLEDRCGLAFHDELLASNASIPFVFMTACGTIAMSVRAMKAGAVDFLEKPFRDQQLLDAVADAIARDEARRETARVSDALRHAYGRLSPREKEVMALVVAGMPNAGVGESLGIALVTVKIHRRAVMTKMGCRTFADLVLKAKTLGVVSLCRTHLVPHLDTLQILKHTSRTDPITPTKAPDDIDFLSSGQDRDPVDRPLQRFHDARRQAV